jgi:hypothetical protein
MVGFLIGKMVELKQMYYNMKIALCFSGHMRDLNETKNFWSELIKRYNIDVYASFWDVEDEKNGDTINNFLKIYTPKKYEVESYKVFKQTTQDFASMQIHTPDVLPQMFQETSKAFGQLPMYYKIWRCNGLSKQLGIEYDLVIRARTDTLLDDNFQFIKNDMLNIPIGTNMCAMFPYSDGINDCFAYGTPKIMDYYSFLFLEMMNYLKSGHYLFPPEHFLLVHFNRVHVKIRFFPTYMLITRVSKGKPHEIYNHFVKEPKEEIINSDEFIDCIPTPEFTFYKNSIKADFIV